MSGARIGGVDRVGGVELEREILSNFAMQTMIDKPRAHQLNRLLTLEEFERAVNGIRRMSPASKEAARLLLVEGRLSGRDVAEMMGVSEGRISQITTRVKEAYFAQAEQITGKGLSEKVDLVQADLDVIAAAARQRYGDQTRIVEPAMSVEYPGEVVMRSEFFALQEQGRGTLVAHRLSRLDIAPQVGENVRIHYAQGRGVVTTPPARDRDTPGR